MPKSHNDAGQAQKFIKVAILESTIEAQLLGSILSEYQIPHFIRSYHDTAYDGLFQVQKGWGEIRAPLSFKDHVLEILNSIRLSDSSS